MRLFVALELSKEVHDNLRALVSRLQRANADVRWVRPTGMHLTLKFIGEVAAEKRAPIEEALGGVRSPAPVRMDFRGLGWFPNERRPRVLWVGVEASENLAGVAAQVESLLEPLGIPREKRDYVPHLTLGRFKSAARLERLQQEIAQLPAAEFGTVESNELVLFQSRLSPAGADYTPLGKFSFFHP